MRRVTTVLTTAFGAALVASSFAARGEDGPGRSPKLSGLTPIVGQAVAFGSSEPVRDIMAKAALAATPEADQKPRVVNPLNSASAEGVPNPDAPPQLDGALQKTLSPGPKAMPAPIANFDGIASADNTAVYGSTVAPPDTEGAVGPNHYVATVNNLVRVYSKAGVPAGPAFKMSSLFTSIGTICAVNNQGDPIVLYDRLASRWMISQFAYTASNVPPFYQCIAVSKTPDPTGAYWAYAFVMPSPGGAVRFNDYPKFGNWPDGYYYSDRQFDGAGLFAGYGALAFNRAKMIAGDPTANYVYFDVGRTSNASSGMVPSDFYGLTPPPAGAPNVFGVNIDDAFTGDTSDGIRLYDFHVDWTTPALSTFTERAESPVAVAAYDSRNPSGRADIEESGGESLDSIGDRIMPRLFYINRGGTESLVFNHTVNAGTIPAAGSFPTAAQYRAATRYYELRRTAFPGTWTVNEQATYAPAADTLERWMGSAAMDSQGNIAVGWSTSSSATFPGVAFAGRLAADAPNGLQQGETVLINGTGAQGSSTSNRWGDYSNMSLDPVDDCTFWYTQEYYATTAAFNWRTRIGSFVFPGCTAPAQGTLAGTITSTDTGLPMAEVLVTVTGGPSTGYATASQADGTYSLKLAPGSYSVTFSSSARTCTSAGPVGATITAGSTTTLNQALGGGVTFNLASTAISGGNGNGRIENAECVDFTTTIQDVGCADSGALTGTLTTTTTGVVIVNATQSFGSPVRDALVPNALPFQISTVPSLGFVCGTPIALTLTLSNGQAFPISIPTCQFVYSGAIAAGDPSFSGNRMTRTGVASTCAAPKACPGQGTGPAGARRYDQYPITNGTAATQCVTVKVNNNCAGNLFALAYTGSFDPANLCTNFLADPGTSTDGTSFSFNLASGATAVLVAYEVIPDAAGTGCADYTLTVSGLLNTTLGPGWCPGTPVQLMGFEAD